MVISLSVGVFNHSFMRLCIPFVGSMSGGREPKTLFMYLSPKGSPYPIQGRERKPSVNITPLAGKIHVQDGLAPTPPGLDLRRAPRISGFAPSQLGWNTVSRFNSEQPHLRPLLSCGVRSATKSKTPEHLGGAWPLAWAITQSELRKTL